MALANFVEAKNEAETILKKYNTTEPVVPVFDIARNEGLEVMMVDMTKLGEEYESVSGFLDTKSKKIYVNQDEPAYRKIFTVAHELGHYVLQHEPDKFDVLYRYSTPIDVDPLEQEANCFAANLLASEDMLKKTMKKHNLSSNDTETLGRLFGVSKEVIKYRLKYLK